jgi:hypothetical protein
MRFESPKSAVGQVFAVCGARTLSRPGITWAERIAPWVSFHQFVGPWVLGDLITESAAA